MSDREAEGEVSRSRVAEWEEPRHPGTASHEAKYPTSSHSATQNPHRAPHWLTLSVAYVEKCLFAGLSWWGGFRADRAGVLHVRAADAARLHAVLRCAAVLPPRWGAKWEEMASACRERREQRRGHEQEHGGDEQQRHHELDLGRGLGGLLGCVGRPAWSAPASAWAASVVESGAPWRSARLSAATSGAVSGARALRGWSSALVGRLPHVGPVGGALELLGEQPRVAAPDLGERAARREARRRPRPGAGPARRAARPPSRVRACGRAGAARTPGAR